MWQFFRSSCACVFFLIILSLPAQASDKRILILGDSLSAAYGLKQADGWVQLLQNMYDEQNRPITLINASISGETTGGALARLPGLLADKRPTHVLIELGGNDGLRGYPLAVLERNLSKIVTLSENAGANVAIISMQIPPNLGKRYTEAFTNTFAKVAKKKNAHLMPFFIEKVATDPSLMLTDNIHPNAKAQPIIRDTMADYMAEWLAE